MSAIGLVYLIAALLVALYGANALFLGALYLRRRAEQIPQPMDPAMWPAVTVQLPLYNELYVVHRLINAVSRLDYPRDRLQIQVLDDSTDETTRLVQRAVATLRETGLDIELLHRDNREGFKAGALEGGLASATGEFVAVFDADFIPHEGFLRETVPHLVADPSLGFVQTRWGYVNATYSALTRAQTLALDGHFVVEHIGRNRNGLLMNFNGTAGLWRRRAIESAGGWQGDTLTEDVDLSFRAQLTGWKALYLPHVESPAELPPQMAAFKRQQARWATGAAQCLVKLTPSLLRGWNQFGPVPAPYLDDGCGESPLPWPARLEAILHLSVWIAHPMSLVLLALTLPMLLGHVSLAFNLGAFWLVALGPTIAYALSQRHLYRDWKGRMVYMPILAAIGMGLALSNSLAIARGLLGRSLPFRRTPKFRIESRGDRWVGNRYALPFEWTSLAELLVAGYALATVAVAIWLGNYLAVPFLLLYFAGFAYIGLSGLRDGWNGLRFRPRVSRTPVVVDS